jgi:hypothetical protein
MRAQHGLSSCTLNSLSAIAGHTSRGVPARLRDTTFSSLRRPPGGAAQYSAHSRSVSRGPAPCGQHAGLGAAKGASSGGGRPCLFG